VSIEKALKSLGVQTSQGFWEVWRSVSVLLRLGVLGVGIYELANSGRKFGFKIGKLISGNIP
jgi:hypothetical protein